MLVFFALLYTNSTITTIRIWFNCFAQNRKKLGDTFLWYYFIVWFGYLFTIKSYKKPLLNAK